VTLDKKRPVDRYPCGTAGQEQFQTFIPLYARFRPRANRRGRQRSGLHQRCPDLDRGGCRRVRSALTDPPRGQQNKPEKGVFFVFALTGEKCYSIWQYFSYAGDCLERV
jgi:hypothetical protein